MNGPYTYRLLDPLTDRKSARFTTKYTQAELEQMTTFQLRGICDKERLVEGFANRLAREELIRVILRFRSAEEHLLITRPNPDGFERMQSALQRNWNDRPQESGGIRVPAKITLYQGVRTGRMDNYRIDPICLG